MSHPGQPLAEAVYMTLASSEALAELVGDRIYDVVPDDAVFPYVTYGQDDSFSPRYDGADFTDCTAVIEVWTDSLTMREANLIAAAVISAMDVRLNVEGFITAEWRRGQVETVPMLADGLRRVVVDCEYTVLPTG